MILAIVSAAVLLAGCAAAKPAAVPPGGLDALSMTPLPVIEKGPQGEFKLYPAYVELPVGYQVKLDYETSPAGELTSWDIDQQQIAYIVDDGVLTAASEGDTMVYLRMPLRPETEAKMGVRVTGQTGRVYVWNSLPSKMDEKMATAYPFVKDAPQEPFKAGEYALVVGADPGNVIELKATAKAADYAPFEIKLDSRAVKSGAEVAQVSLTGLSTKNDGKFEFTGNITLSPDTEHAEKHKLGGTLTLHNCPEGTYPGVIAFGESAFKLDDGGAELPVNVLLLGDGLAVMNIGLDGYGDLAFSGRLCKQGA